MENKEAIFTVVNGKPMRKTLLFGEREDSLSPAYARKSTYLREIQW